MSLQFFSHNAVKVYWAYAFFFFLFLHDGIYVHGSVYRVVYEDVVHVAILLI